MLQQEQQQQVIATGSGTKLTGSNSEESNASDNVSTSSADTAARFLQLLYFSITISAVIVAQIY